mmetsp:Transcript_89312/g.227166  ORF Transcript_89312/g.227166 Transcript_89312/m.227166 type:complete len:217 (+) Transcript_89312:2-652(+)
MAQVLSCLLKNKKWLLALFQYVGWPSTSVPRYAEYVSLRAVSVRPCNEIEVVQTPWCCCPPPAIICGVTTPACASAGVERLMKFSCRGSFAAGQTGVASPDSWPYLAVSAMRGRARSSATDCLRENCRSMRSLSKAVMHANLLDRSSPRMLAMSNSGKPTAEGSCRSSATVTWQSLATSISRQHARKASWAKDIAQHAHTNVHVPRADGLYIRKKA